MIVSLQVAAARKNVLVAQERMVAMRKKQTLRRVLLIHDAGSTKGHKNAGASENTS